MNFKRIIIGIVVLVSFVQANLTKVIKQETIKTFNGSNVLESIKMNDYNEKGKLIKSTEFTSDKTMKSYTLYEYDSKGMLVKSFTYAEDSTLNNAGEYWYNEKGDRIIDRTDYKSSSTSSVINSKYEYDKKGNVIRQANSFSILPALNHEIVNTFDSLGNNVHTDLYFSNTLLQETDRVFQNKLMISNQVYGFDKKNKKVLTETNTFSYKDTLQTKIVEQNYEKGKVTSEKIFIKAYNAEGHIIEFKKSTNGVLNQKIEYSYIYY